MPEGLGNIKVNFPALQETADRLRVEAGELNAYLSDLNRQLQPLFEIWQGDAGAGFAQVQTEWNSAQQTINETLQTIGNAVEDAKDGYVHTETINARVWQR